MTPHPPKPRLTLRVGITGHRPNKLPAESIPRLRDQLVAVFAALEQAAAGIHKEAAAYYTTEAPVFRLISGFAEGADQMATAACPPSWQVEAILPFPKDEYLKDFATSASGDRDVRDEFRQSLERAAVVTQLPEPQPGMRDQGYASAGGYLLRQIDLLIAVWDGLPPKPGGTGAIAREAQAGGIPVIWLATREVRTPRLVAGFDETDAPQAAAEDCTKGSLAAAMMALFSPQASAAAPQPHGEAHEGHSEAAHGHGGHTAPVETERSGLEQYLQERWQKRAHFTAYDLLRSLANRRWPRFVIPYRTFAEREHDWDDFLKLAPAQPEDLRRRIAEVLLPRTIWADTLAVHYSHLYRSAYVFAYFLSAAAVFIALIIVLLPEASFTHEQLLNIKAGLVGSELVVISAILGIIFYGRRGRWHERWLSYRMLAEMLRHGRFLAFVSEFGRVQEGERKSDQLWMLWYIRATMREIGLPTATFDGAYQKAVLNATLVDEIAGPGGQIAYHESNHKTLHHIDHFLHRLGMNCFVFTLFILVAFLVVFGIGKVTHSHGIEEALLAVKPWVTFFSAGLPALGAAVAGIRVHGDFEGATERSLTMLEQLTGLKADYEKAIARGVTLNETGEMLILTAGIMSEDLAVWQDLYGRKRLALPA